MTLLKNAAEVRSTLRQYEQLASEDETLDLDDEITALKSVLEGHIESLMNSVFVLTTAPEAYDGFGTWTVGPSANDPGTRIVGIPAAAMANNWQLDRYASGFYAATPAPECFVLDPEVLDRLIDDNS